MRDAARSHSCDLSQLLPAGCAVAVLRIPTGEGRMIQRSLDVAVPASSTREALATPGHRTGDDAFAHDVRRGLSLPRKQLPCKYFYDERGAALFDEICVVPEYYPTRT